MYLDAARRCKLKEIFENFISSLTLMAKDAILVREIWRDKITEEKIVRGKDGFLYANDELIKRIEAAVQLEEFRLREEAEAAAEDERSSMIQMLIRNGSRQGPVFPIEKHLPSVSQEVFQARDFIYVIGVNEPCVKNKKGNRRKSCRLFNANIAALKRQTFRVLSDIAKRYPDEIEEVRVKGPKLGGKEAYIYHGNVLHLIGKYMEERALQKTLYPPHGDIAKEEACLIVEEWNNMKRAHVMDSSFMSEKGKYLAMMGFPGYELIYTTSGLDHGREMVVSKIAEDIIRYRAAYFDDALSQYMRD